MREITRHPRRPIGMADPEPFMPRRWTHLDAAAAREGQAIARLLQLAPRCRHRKIQVNFQKQNPPPAPYAGTKAGEALGARGIVAATTVKE